MIAIKMIESILKEEMKEMIDDTRNWMMSSAVNSYETRGISCLNVSAVSTMLCSINES